MVLSNQNNMLACLSHLLLVNSMEKSKCIFYLMSCVSETVEGQIRGCIVVIANTAKNRQVDRQDAATAIFKLVKRFPTRVDCVHYVYDDERTDCIVKDAMTTADPRTMVRIKPYFGSFREHKLGLMSVGIPVAVLPMTESEEFDLSYHEEWFRERMIKDRLQTKHHQPPQQQPAQAYFPSNEILHYVSAEDAMDRSGTATPSSTICSSDDDYSTATSHSRAPVGMYPGPLDIIAGKSSITKYHSGNIRYESVLDEYMEEYERSEKMEKTKVAEKIVKRITAKNGRFIKKTDEGWVQISFLEARNKVSMAFRDRRKRQGQKAMGAASTDKPKKSGNGAEARPKAATNTKRTRGD
jgi:hypothetical protein